MVDEKSELDEKYRKLHDFIAGPTFRSLPIEEQDRMSRQQLAMLEYSNVLGERIDCFGGRGLPKGWPNDSGAPYLSETNCEGKVNLVWYPYAVLLKSSVAEKVLTDIRLRGDMSPSLRLEALQKAAQKHAALA